MQIGRRTLMATGVASTAMASTALSAWPGAAEAQPARVGPDAGGTGTAAEPYPNGYVVKAPPVPAGSPTFAQVREGRLQGVEASGVRYFRGVPFAAPPVGPLRFKPPAPAPHWSGTRMATQDPPAELQTSPILEAPSTGEDCLYLNVWAPAAPGPHPVYVYIHGGGNTTGYALEHRANGATFARDGVVCINVGYRLGVFGFVEWGEVLGAPYAGSGNNGLRDLIAALDWVRANAHAFGGNPHDVTIGGQSAGGFDVLALVASSAAEGLFHRAISQSGSGHGAMTMAQAHIVAQRVADGMKKAGADPAQLPAMPAERINEIAGAVLPSGSMNGVVDGTILADLPYRAVLKGQGRGIPLLIGANRDEMSVLGGGGDPAAYPAAQKPLFDAARTGAPALPPAQQAIRFKSIAQFWAPSEIYADNHAAAGGKSYVYHWVWSPGTGRYRGQAFHGIEQPFVWDNVNSIAFRYVVPEPDFQARATQLHALWTAFIKTGTPHAAGVPAWQPWTTGQKAFLEIGDTLQMKSVPAAELKEWNQALNF